MRTDTMGELSDLDEIDLAPKHEGESVRRARASRKAFLAMLHKRWSRPKWKHQLTSLRTHERKRARP